ncbi:hypothetical protein U1Q18_028330 [Sarracenia purpurea var. burkii]
MEYYLGEAWICVFMDQQNYISMGTVVFSGSLDGTPVVYKGRRWVAGLYTRFLVGTRSSVCAARSSVRTILLGKGLSCPTDGNVLTGNGMSFVILSTGPCRSTKGNALLWEMVGEISSAPLEAVLLLFILCFTDFFLPPASGCFSGREYSVALASLLNQMGRCLQRYDLRCASSVEKGRRTGVTLAIR